MSTPHAPLLNQQQFTRAEVTVLVQERPLALTVEGLDYGEGATARLYLSSADERHLINQLGADPFRGSFEINVAYSTSDTGPLTEDRLVDCRLRGTGYHPTPLSVLFVKRGLKGNGRLA